MRARNRHLVQLCSRHGQEERRVPRDVVDGERALDAADVVLGGVEVCVGVRARVSKRCNAEARAHACAQTTSRTLGAEILRRGALLHVPGLPVALAAKRAYVRRQGVTNILALLCPLTSLSIPPAMHTSTHVPCVAGQSRSGCPMEKRGRFRPSMMDG